MQGTEKGRQCSGDSRAHKWTRGLETPPSGGLGRLLYQDSGHLGARGSGRGGENGFKTRGLLPLPPPRYRAPVKASFPAISVHPRRLGTGF